MRKLSKILSILLILTLIVPGFAYADNSGRGLSPEKEAILQKVKDKLQADSLEKFSKEEQNQLFNAEDEVRIIVELESKPSIVYATERNMSYIEMSSRQIEEIERKIEAEQKEVKSLILSRNINMEFINSFKTAFNGFSGKVKYEDIQVIEKLPSVKKVYIANEYEKPDIKPDMTTSKDMIGAIPTWNTGYSGEGRVIAIIDSGIDPSHRDMVLSEDTNPRLTEEIVESMDLLGRYYTEKIPYGYNYFDFNYEIRDIGPGASMHGMHVAGIAGANGDIENGGIKGVAPEAQLLGMKVFSNDPIYTTTFSDIYLVAIDEAIRLGADVINMSLGSIANFYIPDSAEDIALTNATNNGIVCSVSAGNSGSMTWGWTATNSGYPWVENPDIGVVGSPGLNKDTIQVASIENTHQMANSLTYVKDGKEHRIAIAVAGDINPVTALPGEIEFIDCGDGSPEFFTNVSGKIALVVRGGNTPNFVDKITNAQNAGAAGIIVRNHEAGGEELINMATPDVQTIPAIFVGYTDGMALLGLTDKKITFTDDLIEVPNPLGYTMAESTSWGTTPSLELKPEITAPGAKIYSTLNDNQYGTMGGTSMAAPHVAGGSALVLEYIKEHEVYGNLPLSEQARLAKVLLMNTAKVIYGNENVVLPNYRTEISPRRQGAGLMNLYGAINTPVRVVDADTNEAKVELKDFESTEFTMRFKAINDTDTDATYDVDVTVLKDYIYYNALNLLSTDYIAADIDAPETITVPANSEIDFEVTIDIGADNSIYRNMFVEGFVSLVDPDDNTPTLSVPFVGFYGDWGEPAILDGMRFIDPDGYSYFNRAGMLYWDMFGDEHYYNSPRIYMSPGTMEGLFYGTDNIMPYLSFMRNAEEVNYRILDSEGNNLRTILTQTYVRKNYINGGSGQAARKISDAEWDGRVNGEYLPDGDYFYEITAKVHYDGAEFQSKRIPITIDTVAPVIENINLDAQAKKLTWDVVEANGIKGFIVSINGVDLENVIYGEPGKKSYEVDLTEYIGELNIEIVAVDYAMNMGIAETKVVFDNDNPYIYILRPSLWSIFDDSEVLFEGYVANFATLDKVLINETEEADIEFIENATIRHPDDPSTILYAGPAYKFTKVIDLEDGYHQARVEAISKAGARSSLVRRFYVDTTPAELDIVVSSINPKAKTADLTITMRDNLGYLKLLLGDSQIYDYKYPLAEMGPIEKTFTYTVNLPREENTFVFTLYDLANNVTVEEIEISSKVITNVQPAEDIELIAGDTLEVSFNAPTGGSGAFVIVLPFGQMGNELNGIQMYEDEDIPGLYVGTWTVPSDLIASDLIIEVSYRTVNGDIYKEIATGRLTIAGDVEELPINTVIINDEAYDIRYLDANGTSQSLLSQWEAEGVQVYIKLDENTIVNADGELVDIELPSRMIYYDRQGNISIYIRTE